MSFALSASKGDPAGRFAIRDGLVALAQVAFGDDEADDCRRVAGHLRKALQVGFDAHGFARLEPPFQIDMDQMGQHLAALRGVGRQVLVERRAAAAFPGGLETVDQLFDIGQCRGVLFAGHEPRL